MLAIASKLRMRFRDRARRSGEGLLGLDGLGGLIAAPVVIGGGVAYARRSREAGPEGAVVSKQGSFSGRVWRGLVLVVVLVGALVFVAGAAAAPASRLSAPSGSPFLSAGQASPPFAQALSSSSNRRAQHLSSSQLRRAVQAARSRLRGKATPRDLKYAGFHQWFGSDYWFNLYWWTDYGGVWVLDFYKNYSGVAEKLDAILFYFMDAEQWVGPVGYGPVTLTHMTATDGVCPGKTVVITGTNLTGASDVEFNGVSSQSVSVDAPWQLTVVVPQYSVDNVGTNTLLVRTPNGDATHGYNANCGGGGGGGGGEPPTITSVDAPNGFCPGQTVTINGMHFNGPVYAHVYFNGAEVQAYEVQTDTQLVVKVPPNIGTGNGVLAVWNGNAPTAEWNYSQGPCPS